MHQHDSILPLLIGWMAYVVRKNPKAPLHNCSSSTSSPSKTLSNVLLYSFKISLPIFLFSFHLMFPFSPSKVIYFLHSIHFHCHFFLKNKRKILCHIFLYICVYFFTFHHSLYFIEHFNRKKTWQTSGTTTEQWHPSIPKNYRNKKWSAASILFSFFSRPPSLQSSLSITIVMSYFGS